MQLDQIRNKKPEYEARKGIETKLGGPDHIPPEPEHAPSEYDEEETHGTHMLGDEEGKFLKWGKVFSVTSIYVMDRFVSLAKFNDALD
jgi:hypothetical protein